jgi:hypothetical protein
MDRLLELLLRNVFERETDVITDPFASTPDYIAPEIAFPLMAVLWAVWFVLGSKERRIRRAVRKAEQYNDSL